MRIEILNEFLLLAESLSFTETAKNAYVSQPVLSGHISKLEQELGVKLFERDRHSVSLTDAGKVFLPDARRISEAHQTALEHIAQYKDGMSSRITIGFLLGSFGSFLPLVCNHYRRQHPDVEFCFRELDIGEVQSKLNSGQIDIAFTLFTKQSSNAKFEHRSLYEDRYKLAVPRGHRLARREIISIEDLKSEVVLAPKLNATLGMVTQTSIKLRNAGVDVRNDERIADASALMSTVVASGRVAMALNHLEVYGGDNICFIPFEDEGLSLCAGMTWVKGASAEIVKQFADFVVAETAEFTRDDYLSRKGEIDLPFAES